MDPIALVQDLIDRVESLSHRDNGAEDALRRRAEMIIRKIFGKSSKYLEDLKRISFWPIVAPSSEQTKNRVWNRGQVEMRNLFITMKEELELFRVIEPSKEIEFQKSNRIFIVHGHDEEMKQSVARTLAILDLDQIILHEQPDQGRTIIEKFEDYSDVSFAVILLSPDDKGYSVNESSESAKFRARQNVILELGYFIGKIGRNNVVVLFKEVVNFEMPTDYSGVLFVPYDRDGRWRFNLVRELRASGYEVDANRLV